MPVLRSFTASLPLLRSAILGRCPQCGKGPLFSGFYQMKEQCPSCGYSFVREDGYFLGSMVLIYFLTAGITLPLLGFLLFVGHWDLIAALTLVISLTFILNPFLFRFARSLWLSLDRAATLRGFDSKAKDRVITIDCDYVAPEFAASYLLHIGNEAAFIDTNTAIATPKLVQALSDSGIPLESVRYIFVTHVHLDHAGGTAALLKLLPNATVLAHPRAARHLIDPAKLVASARQVYGAEKFHQLYGSIDPIPAERVRVVEDGEIVRLAGAPLRILHTRGHAKHHLCVQDLEGGILFTGDSFGIRYPALQRTGLFIFPSTSPTDFEPDEAHQTVDRLVATQARRIFPTHYGEIQEPEKAAAQLHHWIRIHEEIMNAAIQLKKANPAADPAVFCRDSLVEAFRQECEQRGIALTPLEQELLTLDLNLNAAGLAHVAATSSSGRV